MKHTVHTLLQWCRLDAVETGEAPLPGNFVDETGNVLGQHKGVAHYTVGQRKHIGIALGYPVFIKSIDPDKTAFTLQKPAMNTLRASL